MMRCRNPYIAPGGSAYGCGQCLPCRVNKRREWAHRIMLESHLWESNSFWTLTYDDAHLPLLENGLQTLNPTHLTNFMKRLRKDYQPLKIRYFNVGEYGEQYDRPHYHLALFNFPSCLRGVSQFNQRGHCCGICDRVGEIWGLGKVFSGVLEPNSAAYICGYVTKKLTSTSDLRWDANNSRGGHRTGYFADERREENERWKRYPEFARMSLKPGIGAGYIPEVASVLLIHNLDGTLSDVPSALQVGKRVQPLGRYLKRLLRMHVGRSPDAPQATLDEAKARLLPLQEAARAQAPKGLYSETFKSLILEAHQGHYDRTVARSKIWKKRGSL